MRLDQNPDMSGPPFRPRLPAPATGPVAVRRARVADCGAIAEIYNQAIRSGRATMDTEIAQTGDFAERLAALSARETLRVAEGDARVVGWGTVKAYSERPGYAIACETSIYIDDDAQGRGIGSQMLAVLVRCAGELGYRHLVTRIMGVNQESIDFHGRRGFELVGRQRNIGELDGILHDVVIMQRLLPPPPHTAANGG